MRWVSRHFQVDQHQQGVDRQKVVVQNFQRARSGVSSVHRLVVLLRLVILLRLGPHLVILLHLGPHLVVHRRLGPHLVVLPHLGSRLVVLLRLLVFLLHPLVHRLVVILRLVILLRLVHPPAN